jgi:L-ribulokinase
MAEKLVLGLDFGTDSARAVVVNAENGQEEAVAVAEYSRWSSGLYCDAASDQYRHHPLDYIEALESAVNKALKQLPDSGKKNIAGIGIAATGSTPCAVDKEGAPLALNERFAENPNAMFILWKDHTAIASAEKINETAKNWGGTDFTSYSGGIYSAEWFWAKILHVYEQDQEMARAAFSWVELCDWLPALLSGITDPLQIKRSRCAAGHKAMWHQSWNGLPDEKFLALLAPELAALKPRLYNETYTSDQLAGRLSPYWAKRLNLQPGIAIAVGALDAHMGAVGGGITPGTLVKIMGTSTCDILVCSPTLLGERPMEGICGQVDGSVIPGLIGLEAGQSAFGDVYAWFKELLAWPLKMMAQESQSTAGEMAAVLAEKAEKAILDKLSEEAATLDPAQSTVLALDWLNGRRTPYANQKLKGALTGLTLGTTAPAVFRSLVEATAFGSKAIIDHFHQKGLTINEVIALGGIPKKSPLVIQIAADVLNKPIKVVRSGEACALGAAMFGAVAAGLFQSVKLAQEQMQSGFSETYSPRPSYVKIYQKKYEDYLRLAAAAEANFSIKKEMTR